MSRARRRALVVGALVLALALGAAGRLLGGRPPLTPAQARCAQVAAGLPPATGVSPPRGSSPAVPSPFAAHPPWTPPYPAGDAAVAALREQGRTEQADRLQRVVSTPRALWLADPAVPPARLRAEVAAAASAARQAGRVLVLVTYAIPLRDCGFASAGGHATAAGYRAWTQAVADGLGDGRRDAAPGAPGVAVVVEPDALAALDDLPQDRRRERLALLADAVGRLAGVPGVAVHLDAGHSGWVDAEETARRLAAAGVAGARGFALNVSGFGRTADEVAFGEDVARRLGGAHYLVDVSRNGSGPAPDAAWCNPPGRALGTPPAAGGEHADAFLWVKPPAESDGACGPGQPAAGTFWPERADELARAAGW